MPLLSTVVSLVLVGVVLGQDAAGRGFSRDCTKAYSTTCLKLDVVSFVEKLAEKDSYPILPGVNVVREVNASDSRTSDLVAELARDFPNDAEARLDAFLLKKVEGYLNSHSIRFKLMDKQSVEAARTLVDVSTGRRKKNRMGAALLAGLMMVKGTLLPIGMGALAMMAGKALMTGMMSLMLSAIIGLKSLSKGGGSATYEIVSKPVYTQSHTHSSSHEDHSGYGYGGHSGHGRSYINEELPTVFPPASLANNMS